MNFQFDDNIQPNPLAPWLKIFTILSLPLLEQVKPYVSFTINLQPEDRLFFRDFVLKWRIALQNPEYSSEFKKLTDQIDVNEILDDRITASLSLNNARQSLQELFLYLDSKSIGNEIYRWGRQSYIYTSYSRSNKYKFLKELNQWITFLRRESMRYLLAPSSSQELSMNRDEYALLSTHYKKIYEKDLRTKNLNSKFNQLDMNPETKVKLQKIILFYQEQKFRSASLIQEDRKKVFSPRDSFVYNTVGVHTYLKLESVHRLNLQCWEKINELLNNQQVLVLKYWTNLFYKDTGAAYPVVMNT